MRCIARSQLTCTANRALRIASLALIITLGVAGVPIRADALAQSPKPSNPVATFADDVSFVRQHTDLILLSDHSGNAQVAVAPAWQGRVVTSTAEGGKGASFGWINRTLIRSKETLPHFNPLGGEDRLWLGPEGGQYSIYFAQGAPFDLGSWYVPKPIDSLPFDTISHSRSSAAFQAKFELTNYSGTHFQVGIRREVRVLEPVSIWKALSLPAAAGLSAVGYESHNTLTNNGLEPWRKDTGLLSLWILGMFNPSPAVTIVIPIRAGSESQLGKTVTADYFGTIPADRLHVTADHIFLRGDGQFRSKVGVNPRRSLGKLAAYDATHHVLTIVQFDQAKDVTDYVNSLWKLQPDPYSGDALNSYNDGPPAPGKPPMGPFFELESSSPAAALTPGGSLSHTHRTIHLTGSEGALDRVARAVLGISLKDIQAVFATSPANPGDAS